ncbi:hypothetical protein SAMN05421665_1424 [Yoonia rosea]|uniref:Uncharacterized protein n=1 Tax=Yoonia rosea TaxID=287098 RepID=A0A1R3WV00_9RHOB|nr:hypothetical protein SAMN05421665_1424 [Yoonia rosea]
MCRFDAKRVVIMEHNAGVHGKGGDCVQVGLPRTSLGHPR